MTVWHRGKILAVDISLLWPKGSPHLSCYLTLKGSIYLYLLHSIKLFNLQLRKAEYHLVNELGKVASISARLLFVLWTRSFHLCTFYLCRKLCLSSQETLQFYIRGMNKNVSFTQTWVLAGEKEELKILLHCQYSSPWRWISGEEEMDSVTLIRGWWNLLTCNSMPPAVTETLFQCHWSWKIPDSIIQFHSNLRENNIIITENPLLFSFYLML